jgi:hypothetical protein
VVRQTLIFALILDSICFAQGICGPQDYDSSEQPDLDCPGPGEQAMVPQLHPPASIPLVAGETVTAQWPAALIHKDRLIELGMLVRAVRTLRWLDRLRIAREYEILSEHADQISAMQIELFEQQRVDYEQQLQMAHEMIEKRSKWWRSPVLWFTVGVLTTGALVALTAYGLTAVN